MFFADYQDKIENEELKGLVDNLLNIGKDWIQVLLAIAFVVFTAMVIINLIKCNVANSPEEKKRLKGNLPFLVASVIICVVAEAVLLIIFNYAGGLDISTSIVNRFPILMKM